MDKAFTVGDRVEYVGPDYGHADSRTGKVGTVTGPESYGQVIVKWDDGSPRRTFPFARNLKHVETAPEVIAIREQAASLADEATRLQEYVDALDAAAFNLYRIADLSEKFAQ